MAAQRGGDGTPVRKAIANAPATARTVQGGASKQVEPTRAGPLETIAKQPRTSRATVSRASSRASKAAAKPQPVSVKTTRARLKKQIASLEQSLQEKQAQLQDITKRTAEAKRGKIIPAQFANKLTAAEAEIKVIQGQLDAAREQLNATYKRKAKPTTQLVAPIAREPEVQPVAPVVAKTAVQAPSVDADLLAAAGVEAKAEVQRLNGELEAARKEVARLAGELEGVQKQLEKLQASKTCRIERVTFDPREQADAQARIAELEASLNAMQAKSKAASKAADVEELKQRLERAERTLLEVSKSVSDFLQSLQGGSGGEKTKIVNVERQVRLLIQIINRQREHIETLRTRATRAEATIAAQDTRTDHKAQAARLQKRVGRLEWLAIGLFTVLGLSNVGWFAYTKFHKPPAVEETVNYNDAYREAPRGFTVQEEAGDYGSQDIVEQVQNLGRFEFNVPRVRTLVGIAMAAAVAVLVWVGFRRKK